MKRIYERVRMEIIVCDNTYETSVLSLSNGTGGEVDNFGDGTGTGGEIDDFD